MLVETFTLLFPFTVNLHRILIFLATNHINNQLTLDQIERQHLMDSNLQLKLLISVNLTICELADLYILITDGLIGKGKGRLKKVFPLNFMSQKLLTH